MTIYTCPMDPEIIKDAPGTCPKCGMELVLLTGEDHGGHADHVSMEVDLKRRNLKRFLQ